MCLQRIDKKTSADEGRFWKNYLKVGERYYSAVREEEALIDCWILNQEPKTSCACGVKKIETLEDVKNKYGSIFFQTFGISSLGQPDFQVINKKSYEHGFHGWKSQLAAIELKHSPDAWIKAAVNAKDLEIVIIEVFYRGYIAEDSNQIVARQIYIPVHTEQPSPESKTWEVNKKQFIA